MFSSVIYFDDINTLFLFESPISLLHSVWLLKVNRTFGVDLTKGSAWKHTHTHTRDICYPFIDKESWIIMKYEQVKFTHHQAIQMWEIAGR